MRFGIGGFASLAFCLLANVSIACAGDARKTIELPGDQVFPESISAGPDDTLYIGSAGKGGVLRAGPGAKRAESWIPPGAFGSHSIFGVFADARSQTLWVCSNELATQSRPGSPSTGALIGFDLKSGQGKVKADFPVSPATCNDIAVAHDGSVYVTNSAAPQILKLNTQTHMLDVWLTDPRFQPKEGIGLDGIAIGRDGTVYVDIYSDGSFFQIPVVDGKAGEPDLMPISRHLVRPDALRPIFGNAFLLIEGDGRLDRIGIEGSEAEVYTLQDGLRSATGIAQTDGKTWVAEGQLSLLFDPAKKGRKASLPFRLLSIDY